MAKVSKKGFFFTFVAIMVASIVVLVFASQTYFTLKHKVPVVKTRVMQADDYVKSLKYGYLDRALHSSSYAALNALVYYINSTDSYLVDGTDLSSKFSELLVYGTIGGVAVVYDGDDLMKNKTFVDRLELIENMSLSAMQINTTFKNSDFYIAIYQSNETGPWQVAVNATVSFFVDADLASWNDTVNITAMFNFYNLSDPLYVVNEEGDAYKFRKAPTIVWNYPTFVTHVNDRTYKHNREAPSFLQRFYGDFSGSDCCGIESIRDKTAVNKLTADYCYFDASCPVDPPYNLYTISGVSNNVKLDIGHVTIYNVEAEASLAWQPPP